MRKSLGIAFVMAVLGLGLVLPFALAAAPVITVHSPQNGTFYNTTNIILNVSTDLLSDVNYWFNDGTPTLLYQTNFNGVNNLGTVSENNKPLQGLNKIIINASNGTEQTTQTLFFTVDSVAPTITLRTPQNNFATENPTNTFDFIPTDAFSSTLSCSIYFNGAQRAGPVNVVNDTRGKFVVSLPADNYEWSVRCWDSLFNMGESEKRALEIKSKCGIDARELTGKGNLLSVVLENTGTLSEEVDYSIKVNLNQTASDSVRLNPGEKKEVLHNFTFSVGNYQLEATTTSDCGAQDYITSGYAKTAGPANCTNPVGDHNSFRMEPLENKIFKCDNGFWTLASEGESSYCSSTTVAHCGDGIVNCGETRDSCGVDYNASVKCNCQNKTLYVDNNLKTQQEFYDTCKNTCSLQCNSDSDCSSGSSCAYFTCLTKPTNCGVSIQDFDYTSQVGLGENGRVFANIKNTGSGRQNISAVLKIDSAVKEAASFYLNSGTDKLATFFYNSTVGQHDLVLETVADCGATDRESVKTTVRNISVSSLPDVPLSTEVRLKTESLETRIGAERPLQLNIKTNKPQLFTLNVSGVPQDWVNYPSTVGVTEDRSINIFVKPREKGEYNITIFILGKDQNFTATARIKAITEGEEITVNQKTIIILAVSVVILFSLAFFLASKILHL